MARAADLLAQCHEQRRAWGSSTSSGERDDQHHRHPQGCEHERDDRFHRRPRAAHLRLLRGKVPLVLDEYDYAFDLGKANVLRGGTDVVNVSSGRSRTIR